MNDKTYAVTDIPAAIFVEELVSAYPEAKVMLSIRDEDSWYSSMEETVWGAWKNGPSRDTTGKRMSDAFHKCLWNSDFPQYGREAFRKHNDRVQKYIPSKQLLVYEVKHGWEPICRFLEKEIPSQDFPRSDDWKKWKLDKASGS